MWHILFAFENTSYQERLSRHVKLPYKDSWYEKDAFYYIKGQKKQSGAYL